MNILKFSRFFEKNNSSLVNHQNLDLHYTLLGIEITQSVVQKRFQSCLNSVSSLQSLQSKINPEKRKPSKLNLFWIPYFDTSLVHIGRNKLYLKKNKIWDCQAKRISTKIVLWAFNTFNGCHLWQTYILYNVHVCTNTMRTRIIVEDFLCSRFILFIYIVSPDVHLHSPHPSATVTLCFWISKRPLECYSKW